jgi:3-hydroxybutyryl-CoA dehydratase
MTGPAVASITKQLSQAQVNEYADAADDHNPIHTDEAFAAASPFGGTIAHGMLVLATISEMMAASLGEAWLMDGKLKVRFKSPAKTTSALTASATALKTDGSALRYAIECRNEDDDVLISGTAQVRARE